MNNQKPEPRDRGDGMTLDFHSMFFTIQGEGPFAGHRAIFIRLAGCNLQCPGCDTEYTERRKQLPTSEIVRQAYEMWTGEKPPLVVITGGEPLRQDIGQLVRDLVWVGFTVQIESNGVFAPSERLTMMLTNPKVHLVVSPKTQRISTEAGLAASAFKYVLDHRSVDPVDGLPIKALDHPAARGVARPTFNVPVYLNPFDAGDAEENKKNLAAVAKSCMAHGYILGVQIHKLIGLA